MLSLSIAVHAELDNLALSLNVESDVSWPYEMLR